MYFKSYASYDLTLCECTGHKHYNMEIIQTFANLFLFYFNLMTQGFVGNSSLIFLGK